MLLKTITSRLISKYSIAPFILDLFTPKFSIKLILLNSITEFLYILL